MLRNILSRMKSNKKSSAEQFPAEDQCYINYLFVFGLVVFRLAESDNKQKNLGYPERAYFKAAPLSEHVAELVDMYDFRNQRKDGGNIQEYLTEHMSAEVELLNKEFTYP